MQPSTAAARLSRPLRPLDRPANAITDAMNAAVPWLWWPLPVPARDAPMPRAAHVLFVVHAAILAALGWLWFTGAWDRRALREGR